ncbi:MAG: flagellar biosynthetic protein FliO [Bryobacteraceae bacterium]
MELLRQLAAVGVVFGLLAAALWVLRRRGLASRGGILRPRKGSGRLESLERLALSPQHTLHLVRVQDRALLIGAHSGGCTLLESLALPVAPGRARSEAQ